jgi:hypothetical protein
MKRSTVLDSPGGVNSAQRQHSPGWLTWATQEFVQTRPYFDKTIMPEVPRGIEKGEPGTASTPLELTL